MPRVRRKASSLFLFGLLTLMALVSALGSAGAQEGGYTGITRVLTITADESGCDAGNCLWDTPRLVFRPGDTIVLIADLTQATVPHNLKIGDVDEEPEFDVTYEPASSDGTATQAAAGIAVFANFTIPADYAETEIAFICTLHQPSMSGELLEMTAFREAGGEPEAIHHLGVHFLAYWVGLIAFAVLFIVYGITFFLFKYNETSATTDQWDRTGAGAPEVKNKMSSGSATLIAILIGIVALAAIVWLARTG